MYLNSHGSLMMIDKKLSMCLMEDIYYVGSGYSDGGPLMTFLGLFINCEVCYSQIKRVSVSRIKFARERTLPFSSLEQ